MFNSADHTTLIQMAGLADPTKRMAGSRLGLGAVAKKRPPKGPKFGPPQPKTPYQALQEKLPVVNQILQFETGLGSGGKPRFRCTVELQGRRFSADGGTKKEAKQRMAVKACHALLPGVPIIASPEDNTDPEATQDFTPMPAATAGDDGADGTALPPMGSQKAKKLAYQKRRSHLLEKDKLAQLVHEKCIEANRGESYVAVYSFEDVSAPEAKPHEKKFQCTATLGDYKVMKEGVGRKQAKNQCCRSILVDVFGLNEQQLLMAEEISDWNPFVEDLDSPLQALHQLCQRKNVKPEWNIDTSDGKPVTAQSVFMAVLKIGDRTFTETSDVSGGKNAAKVRCAIKALKDVFNVEMSEPSKDASRQSRLSDAEKLTRPQSETKPPVQLLNEICSRQKGTKSKTEWADEGEYMEGNSKMYRFKVTVGDEEFTGSGRSKKIAKVQAARAALLKMFNVPTPEPMELGTKRSADFPMEETDYGQFAATKRRTMPKTLGELMSILVRDKYAEICKLNGITPTVNMAGFVVTTTALDDPAQPITPEIIENATVVSVAAGAKCLDYGSSVGNTGLVLLDCHCEVLARRGLLLFLYQQLGLLQNSMMEAMSLFEPSKSGAGYKLKDNVKIHFYSNLPPPGDARVKPLPGAVTGQVSRDENQLRFYTTGGGSIPIGTVPQQSYMTLRSGQEPLKIMSVSDKMLKWNAIGVQGALISHYIQPIYVSNYVFGTQYDHTPVERALYARLIPTLGGQSIPKPNVLDVEDKIVLYERPKDPECAVTWNAAMQGIELIAQETGKDLTGKSSQLCKQILFDEFAKLNGRLKPIVPFGKPFGTYNEAKKMAESYNKAKSFVYEKLEGLGFGRWMRKPDDIEQFGLPWSDY